MQSRVSRGAFWFTEFSIFRSLVNYFDLGNLGIRLRFSYAFVCSYMKWFCGLVFFIFFCFELQGSLVGQSQPLWALEENSSTPGVPASPAISAAQPPPDHLSPPVKTSPLWPPPRLTPLSVHPAASLALAEPSQCTHRAEGTHERLATVLVFLVCIFIQNLPKQTSKWLNLPLQRQGSGT